MEDSKEKGNSYPKCDDDKEGDGNLSTILLDMDNTLVDWDEKFLRLWFEDEECKDFDCKSLVTNRKNYMLQDCLPPHLRKSAYKQANKVGYYTDLKPFPGSIEAVRKMSEIGHQVFFVTVPNASQPSSAMEKMSWIGENIGEDYISKLILTFDKTVVKGEYLIDDKPLIVGSGKPTWKHIVYDQPYNQHVEGYRLKDWSQWQEVIKSI